MTDLEALPEEFRVTSKRIAADLPEVLGANLVGIYLYGSAVDSTFVPDGSDLDCIVVTADALDSPTFHRLERWLADAAAQESTFARVQMSLLVRDRVLFDDPTACLFQFGALRRGGSDGNPIIWLDFFRRGFVLHGPDPRSFVPEVTPEILDAALLRELGYLREEFSAKPESEWRDRDSYRAYAVLTLCRILYTRATRQVASKADAASWAIAHTPGEPELHDLIRIAEGIRNQRWIVRPSLFSVETFISYVEKRMNEEGEAT